MFLSRPRRFGKSLTIDMIAELFSGNKALFEGLYVKKYRANAKQVFEIGVSFDAQTQELEFAW